MKTHGYVVIITIQGTLQGSTHSHLQHVVELSSKVGINSSGFMSIFKLVGPFVLESHFFYVVDTLH